MMLYLSYSVKGLVWTTEELLALKEMYSNKIYQHRQVPDVLKNRTNESIFQKACKMKISRCKTVAEDIGTQKLDISETDKAYIAGIIDGEGHIVLRGTRKEYVIVGITNTNENLIRWIENKLNSICTHSFIKEKKNGYGHLGTKKVWLLTIERASSVYVLLDAIVPFLVVKKEKAIQAMKRIRAKYGVIS